MADLATTRIFGNLTVMREAILKANATIVGYAEFKGKSSFGDSLNHENINNVLNFNSTTGANAFRPLNFVDTSGVIKVARINDTSGAGIELSQWDDTIENNISRGFVVAENGNVKLWNVNGTDILLQTSAGVALTVSGNDVKFHGNLSGNIDMGVMV